MLLGQSGVGKSTLAEKIYLYAKKKKIIGKEAPFIVLNQQTMQIIKSYYLLCCLI